MIESIAHLGLLDDEEIAIDSAAIELSALDHEGLDTAPYLARLAAMEDELAAIAGGAESAFDRAGLLAHILAERHGFRGDRDSYDAPLNADLIRVLDRHRGLPVSLSILYVGLARRVGWRADALNTPGHVLVRIGPDEKAVVADPFNDGRLVTHDMLLGLVRQALGSDAGFDPRHLAPMSNRMTLVRLLLNQATRAEKGHDPARAMSLYERIVTVAPSLGQGWWDLARLQLGAGRIEEARNSLSAMLEVTRDADSRTHIAAALEALAGR
jgi:regulator of sirC expression with transglutaminase-like and TPR domain